MAYQLQTWQRQDLLVHSSYFLEGAGAANARSIRALSSAHVGCSQVAEVIREGMPTGVDTTTCSVEDRTIGLRLKSKWLVCERDLYSQPMAGCLRERRYEEVF